MTTYEYEINPIEKVEVWTTIRNQIERNTRKRTNWKLILGSTLTRVITRLRISGASPTDAYNEIINNPIMKLIKENYINIYYDMCEKIKIGVCARYGEQKQEFIVFNSEFKDKTVVEKNE
jgi:hypothetical protein